MVDTIRRVRSGIRERSAKRVVESKANKSTPSPTQNFTPTPKSQTRPKSKTRSIPTSGGGSSGGSPGPSFTPAPTQTIAPLQSIPPSQTPTPSFTPAPDRSISAQLSKQEKQDKRDSPAFTGNVIEPFQERQRPFIDTSFQGSIFTRIGGGLKRNLDSLLGDNQRFSGGDTVIIQRTDRPEVFVAGASTSFTAPELALGGIGKVPQTKASKKDFERAAFIRGQLGKPLEFVVQDTSKRIGGETQKEFDTFQADLQKQLSGGKITRDQAELKLQTRRAELETRSQGDLNRELEKVFKTRSEAEKEFKDIRRSQKIDISPIAVNLPILAGAAAGGGLAGVGALGGIQLASISGLPQEEKFGRFTEGTLNIALGSSLIGKGAFKSLEDDLIRTRADDLIQSGIKTPFKEGEIGEIFIKSKGDSGISLIGGEKSLKTNLGRFQQEFASAGPVLRSGDDVAFFGKGISNIKVNTEPINIIGRGSKPQEFIFKQNVQTLGTGKAFSTQTEGVSFFVGDVLTSAGGKETFSPIGAIIKSLPNDRSITKSGKLIQAENIGFSTKGFDIRGTKAKAIIEDVRPKAALINIETPDTILTQTIKLGPGDKTFGGVTGFSGGNNLKGNLPSAGSLIGNTQANIGSSLTGGVFKKGLTDLGKGIKINTNPLKGAIPKGSPGITGRATLESDVSKSVTNQFSSPQSQIQSNKLINPIKVSSRDLVDTRVATGSRASTKTKSVQKQNVVSLPKLSQDISQSPVQKSAQIQLPKSRTLQEQSLNVRSPGITATPFGGFGIGGLGGFKLPPILPPKLGGDIAKGNKGRGRIKLPTKIRTSLTGKFLGRIGLPKGGKLGVTPSDIRGFVEPVKKKVKRKVKKRVTKKNPKKKKK